MLYSNLTETDKNLIEYYITHYANESEGKKVIPLEAPLSKVLGEWNTSKERLYKLFGEKFIISDHVKIEHNSESNYQKFAANPTYTNFVLNLRDSFEEMFSAKRIEIIPIEGMRDTTLYYRIRALVDCFDISRFNSTKLSNDFFGCDITTIKIKHKDTGKVYSFQNGEKVMKAIKKLVDITGDPYCTEHFEEFRIFISQVLNEKYLEGELCVSIHPLDFMTMSHNGSKWRSCMKWDSDGCYKAGTVEMMNSASVVVAYLKSSKDFDIGDGNMWNNKKWRGLYIVGDDFIFSVKGYPYQNSDLDEAVLKLIGRTANANAESPLYNTNVIGEVHGDYDEDWTVCTATRCIYCFTTEKMYNDIAEWEGDHYYITDIGIKEELPPRELKSFDFEYSGKSTCVLCGEWNDEEEEVELICSHCKEHYTRCTYCHHLMEETDIVYNSEGAYYYDPQHLCQECFEKYHFFDPLDKNQLVSQGNSYPIMIVEEVEDNKYKVIGEIRCSYNTYNTLLCNEDHSVWEKYFNDKPLKFDYSYYSDYYITRENFKETTKENFPITMYERPYNVGKNGLKEVVRSYRYE